ncbi:thiolase, N-terminal domain protein [Mycobacterium ulcerans str. Harvey]|uniref:Thiolase, N-terminal domain protein n=1 Tax=Mycobacterium ulcerans str. Harvey TaxID=1299332 RepID=A0ABN0R722_MYCUL|nr:thiolase, N-terminal domain protein [Mycobacterium ulcerans str. Harvey]
MPEAVIVAALRTPIGTARKGTLRDTNAFDLAHHVVSEATADLDPGQIDDVILGEGLYGGGVIARHAAITAGLVMCPVLPRIGTVPPDRRRCRARPQAYGRGWTSSSSPEA